MTYRILAALALIALAGCGALPMQPSNDDTDHARVSAVEQAATFHGVKVYWVNAPRKTASGG